MNFDLKDWYDFEKLFPRVAKWPLKMFNLYILERNDKLLKCLTKMPTKVFAKP
jgi:hypothetical protein